MFRHALVSLALTCLLWAGATQAQVLSDAEADAQIARALQSCLAEPAMCLVVFAPVAADLRGEGFLNGRPYTLQERRQLAGQLQRAAAAITQAYTANRTTLAAQRQLSNFSQSVLAFMVAFEPIMGPRGFAELERLETAILLNEAPPTTLDLSFIGASPA